jgi:hypothetical protein
MYIGTAKKKTMPEYPHKKFQQTKVDRVVATSFVQTK